MIRASLKSLLARRVRLLLSTFAIVLGVAFVTGILMFSDTLNRSFTALFASTVGDSRGPGPEGSDLGGEGRRDQHADRAGLARAHPRAAARRRPGRRHGQRDRRLRPLDREQGRRRLRAAGVRRQLERRPGRSRSRGAGDPRRPRAARRRRGGARRDHRRPGRLRARRPGLDRHRDPDARRAPDAGRHRRLPRGRLAQRRDVRRLRHPDRAGAVPGRPGCLQRLLGDRRRTASPRRS